MAKLFPGQIRLHRQCQRAVLVTDTRTTAGWIEVCIEDVLGEWKGGWLRPYELGDPMSEMEAIAWAASGANSLTEEPLPQRTTSDGVSTFGSTNQE